MEVISCSFINFFNIAIMILLMILLIAVTVAIKNEKKETVVEEGEKERCGRKRERRAMF